MYDFTSIVKNINNLKRSKKLITNAYFSTLDLERKNDSGNCIIHLNDKFISILEDNNSFLRLYFYMRSDENIIELIQYLKTIGNKTIALDMVGRNPFAQIVTNLLCQHNFKTFANFSRWQAKPTKRILNGKINNVAIEIAKSDNANEILGILTKHFDPITSHLPNIDKIDLGIRNDEIFVVKNSGRIAALIWVENNGVKTKYIYQLVVLDEFRNMRYGRSLYEFIFNLYDVNTVYTVWTDDENDAINNVNKFFGFNKDGLVNHILTFENKGEG